MSTPRLGGDPGRWRALPLVQESREGLVRTLRSGADESYWYIAVELAAGNFPWDSLGLQLAIDTHRPGIGQHLLPRSGVRSQIGFEFLVDLLDTRQATLRVTPEYNRHEARIDPKTGDDFGRFSRRPVKTVDRDDGRFDSLFVIINRARFGRDGRFYRAQGYDRGRLRYGIQDSSSLADWYVDGHAGLLEIRIPWDLLNVTDPSTRTLLDDRRTRGSFGTAQAAAFHVGVVVYKKTAGREILGALPDLSGGVWGAKSFHPFRWEGWTSPRAHGRLKPVYDSLRRLWQEAPAGAPARPSRTAPSN